MAPLKERKAARKERAKENAELHGVDVPAEALGVEEKPAKPAKEWKANA